jgi:hypothetical protein
MSSDIIGSAVTYARGGGSDGWDASQQYGAGGNFGGLGAQPGVVIVAYQIGVSTLAQIKVAQTVRKAELRKAQLAEKALQKQQALEAKLRK